MCEVELEVPACSREGRANALTDCLPDSSVKKLSPAEVWTELDRTCNSFVHLWDFPLMVRDERLSVGPGLGAERPLSATLGSLRQSTKVLACSLYSYPFPYALPARQLVQSK